MLLHHYTTAQHSRAQHSTAVTVTVTLTRLLTLYNTEYSFKSVTPSLPHSPLTQVNKRMQQCSANIIPTATKI
jgi:hypothetical protein